MHAPRTRACQGCARFFSLGVLLLGLVLSSGGCARQASPSPAPPTAAEEETAMEALLLCIRDQVRVIDDFRSEARTITELVFLACDQPYRTAVDTHWHRLVATGAVAPDTQPLFVATMQVSMKRRILGVVLDSRRSR